MVTEEEKKEMVSDAAKFIGDYIVIFQDIESKIHHILDLGLGLEKVKFSRILYALKTNIIFVLDSTFCL